MPLRFHRSFKIAPGIRMNLSKRGFGTSLGGKGFHYSIGPKGTRLTSSIPGTGVSFVQQSNEKKSRKLKDEPIVSDPQTDSKIRRGCVWFVLILVAILISIIAFVLGSGSSGGEPTPTNIATSAQISTPTQPAEVTAIPSQTVQSSSSCTCTQDYNCSDFSTHQQAQACFSSCGGSASSNWSSLDGTDHDGLVCETLP